MTANGVLGVSRGAIVLCATALAAGCASSGPSARPSSGKVECQAGTFGLEAGSLSRQLRKTLGLADDFQGALVTEVLPGGPAAAVGIRPDDVVVEIGTAHIGNDCEFSDAASSRSCKPVRVVLRRGGENVEVTLVPVEQDSFFEKSCSDGIASACFRQGWLLWGRNQGVDRERTMGLYDSACKAGFAGACAYQGLRLMDLADRGADAIGVLERSCDLRSGAGCAHLAFLYATGKVVKKDDRRATALYVKACDLGDAKGCYNVGLMADEGRGTARDFSRAAARYDEACELGSSTACTNLGFLFENGRGVKKDTERAVALYQRGCDGSSCQPPNLGGCLNVGRALRDGIGLEKDAARAASIFQDACDRRPDPGDIHADENSARACSLLGGLYLAGDGVQADLTKGRELSERGCDRGDSFGCFNAAVVFTNGSGVEADPAKAATFLDRACAGGDGEGCNDLAVAYEKGTGVIRDRRRSVELFKKACELGFQSACAKKKR